MQSIALPGSHRCCSSTWHLYWGRQREFGRKSRDVFPNCVLVLLLALFLSIFPGCGSSGSSPSAAVPSPSVVAMRLAAADVGAIVQAAAASVNSPLVIAVADRIGAPLAVFRSAGVAQNASSMGNFGVMVGAEDLALGLARTAAFFSNDQAPLSSRTVRFISGIHFPPGVSFAANGDLYGIENTNRGCSLNASFLPGQDIPPAESLVGGNGSGLGVITGKADFMDSDPNAVNPGGVPLFKNGKLVGGVGVVSMVGRSDVAEFAAFSGSSNAGFLPLAQLPPPGIVVINGISLPFVNQTAQPNGTAPATAAGSYDLGPKDGSLPPETYLVGPSAGNMLTTNDVTTIVDQTIATASITRAVIRLPQGQRTKMTIAVADLNGNLLALYRMPDSTMFSADVAVAKARNVIWFSSPPGAADLTGLPPGTAVTNRTIGFGAQPLFPPGIDNSGSGPFFNLYSNDSSHPCTQGSDPQLPQFQNGVVFFPGSVPLYKNGVLVGGLGVSGDGVDEDDFVSNGGAQGFMAPANMRADQIVIRNVRLPYLKFPANPTN
jgi:uncharacterized protein GlcG (DUF336 family)